MAAAFRREKSVELRDLVDGEPSRVEMGEDPGTGYPEGEQGPREACERNGSHPLPRFGCRPQRQSNAQEAGRSHECGDRSGRDRSTCSGTEPR